jgi:beta-phosphoglucomutase family hydrolase
VGLLGGVLEAVLWDMDGVIVDTEPFHWEAWRRMGREEGFSMTYPDFQRTFGRRNVELLREFLDPGVPDQRVRDLGDRKEALYRQLARGDVKPLPGAMALLQALHRAGCWQAVASSAPQANVDLILAELNIRDYFGAVLSARDVERGKPDPQVFLRAAERLGADPAHCVVIEDAVTGVEAAKRAGMACLAVTTTHPAEALAAADRVVTSLEVLTYGDLQRLVRMKRLGGDR